MLRYPKWSWFELLENIVYQEQAKYMEKGTHFWHSNLKILIQTFYL